LIFKFENKIPGNAIVSKNIDSFKSEAGTDNFNLAKLALFVAADHFQKMLSAWLWEKARPRQHFSPSEWHVPGGG